jgi:uncharacterized membrane protein
MFGVSHFTQAEKMAGMVPVPGGVFWVYFTGVAMLAAAVGIITNFNMRAQNEAQRMMPMISFLKDLGLAGGAWAIARLMKA